MGAFTFKKLNQRGFDHMLVAVVLVVVFGIAGSYYLIKSRAASQAGQIVGIGNNCLDNQDVKRVNSNPIQMYDCGGSPAQVWSINSDGSIVNSNGYCLDVTGASKAEYTYVQLYQCNGTVAQKWKLQDDKYLVNTNTGFCATVQYASTTNRTRVWMKSCHASEAQMWHFRATSTSVPTPAPAPSPAPAPAPSPAPPTTSACSSNQPGGSTLYTSLAGSSLTSKLNSTSGTVALPANTYTFSNMPISTFDSFQYAGISITGASSLVGSGIDKTIIQPNANSSDKASVAIASGTNRTNLLITNKSGIKMSCFTLKGSAQPHLYNGIRLSGVSNAVLSDIKLVGAAPGNSNVPPGETFAINDYLGKGNTYKNVEIDGAGSGASAFGANGNLGVTSNNTWTDDYAHNNPYSAGIALWQLNGTQTLTNFRSVNNRTGINLERMIGTVNITKPTLSGNTSQDFFIGNDKGSAKINIYDPVLDAGKKIRIYFPAKEQGSTNIQNKADIKVFVSGKDVTANLIQWL